MNNICIQIHRQKTSERASEYDTRTIQFHQKKRIDWLCEYMKQCGCKEQHTLLYTNAVSAVAAVAAVCYCCWFSWPLQSMIWSFGRASVLNHITFVYFFEIIKWYNMVVWELLFLMTMHRWWNRRTNCEKKKYPIEIEYIIKENVHKYA